MSEEFAIAVRDVSKCYQVYEQPGDRLKQAIYPRLQRGLGAEQRKYFREFWALRNVSLTVRPGETMGIIGRNGSGKSTLLQLICGTLAPTAGEVETNGRVAALLELGSGFNPEFTGRENVFMNGAVLGLTDQEIADRFDRIVEFSEIGDFIDQPVKTYSSGMFMRLAFAVQAHIDASIVVIDEALTVGDVFFRQKCYARLEQLRDAGAAILLVSHSMPDIEQLCERAILLDHGNTRFIGPSGDAAKHYYLLHQPQRPEAAMIEAADEVETEMPSPLPSAVEANRPADNAFLDISDKVQVSDGRARCTGVAILDERGAARLNFKQHERAFFYFEFEVDGDIGVPVCGMTISNERGVIVHGKNNLQYADVAPVTTSRTRRVSCYQEISLNLAAGDYTFQIGLASTSREDWDNRVRMPYEAELGFVSRICHISNAGTFSVRMGTRNGVSFLTHHGIADLPGEIIVHVG
ncbi:ABC transporter ATP-binding protein [Lysobacter sp. TAF61]|uniref:ABC transporter ATP-binding protein n=1 Tax=Lysobacter sp. TAF61 TaxID=3233072 RepID=UPI003F99CA52